MWKEDSFCPPLPNPAPSLDCQDLFYVKDTLRSLPFRFNRHLSNQSFCKLSTLHIARLPEKWGIQEYKLSKQKVQIQRKGSLYCRSQEGLFGKKVHWKARVQAVVTSCWLGYCWARRKCPFCWGGGKGSVYLLGFVNDGERVVCESSPSRLSDYLQWDFLYFHKIK